MEQDEVLTHWEDAKEEGSRGTDIKSVPGVKMETPEDEAEEQDDDDDLGCVKHEAQKSWFLALLRTPKHIIKVKNVALK